MKKKELIAALHGFLNTLGSGGYDSWKGQKEFATYLIYYLETTEIPNEKTPDWYIEDRLPQIILDAWEAMRLASDPLAIWLRQQYKNALGSDMPNITHVGASPVVDQSHAVQAIIGYTLAQVTGNKTIERKIADYIQAEWLLLQQRFDRFVREVYRNGLYTLIINNPDGLKGRFGHTELETFADNTTISLTFICRRSGNRGLISFSASRIDSGGLDVGISSVTADLMTSLDMFNEVISLWLTTPDDQANKFRPHID